MPVLRAIPVGTESKYPASPFRSNGHCDPRVSNGTGNALVEAGDVEKVNFALGMLRGTRGDLPPDGRQTAPQAPQFRHTRVFNAGNRHAIPWPCPVSKGNPVIFLLFAGIVTALSALAAGIVMGVGTVGLLLFYIVGGMIGFGFGMLVLTLVDLGLRHHPAPRDPPASGSTAEHNPG